MAENRTLGRIALASSTLALGLLSFQYPLSSPVPIGGDAPAHIQAARHPFRPPPWRLVSAPWSIFRPPYPLSQGLFTLTRALPFPWATRFTVWMGLGHFATGLAIGAVLFRLAGRSEAAVGMALWAATTVGVLPFFRAGTLHQLWSLFFAMLFLLAVISGSSWRQLIALGAIILAHPATAVVVGLAASLTLPPLILARWTRPRVLRPLWSAAIILGVAVGLLLLIARFADQHPYIGISPDRLYRSVWEVLGTRFSLALIVAPLGFARIAASSDVRKSARAFLLTFGVLSCFLAFNRSFGFGVWEQRLFPYAVLAGTLFGSVGLIRLARLALPNAWIRAGFLSVLLSAVLLAATNDAGAMYRQFRNPERSSLLPAERAAYEWMRERLPSRAVILVSEKRGRGNEWIPVIADRGIYGEQYSGPNPAARALLRGSVEEIIATLPRTPATHAIVYRSFEDAPQVYADHPELFRVVYENTAVVLFALPAHPPP